jgi:hypothetical protein
MLSSNFKGIEKPTKKEFTPLPEDTYQVQIADITDKTKPNFEGDMAVYLDFEYVILDEAFRGRRIWKDVRPIVVGARAKKASWLYLIIEKTLGTEMAQAIENDPTQLDLTKLIGKQIRIMVNQTVGRNGNTYNNVVQFLVTKEPLDPFEKGEKSTDQPVQGAEQPRAGSDREMSVKGIFAIAKKLYPTLSAAPEPKDALKEMVERDFSIKVESWSKASTEQLNDVYRAMKNEEAKRVTATLGTGPKEDAEINVDDIPF